MDSPTKDQQSEESSVSETVLDNVTEDTSTSNPSEKEASTFDVVMSAIKAEGEKTDEDVESDKDKSDKPEGDASKEEKAKGEAEESGEPTEEELKAWKPKTRKRFENLQAKYRDVSERLVQAETDAGQYKRFVDFLDTNGVTGDEANKLFNIGALMKNDPFAALQAITPYYQQLLEVTGQILPRDLQEQVNAGYLTQAHAVEVSRARAMGRVAPAITQEKQQRQQQREVRQQEQNVQSVQSSIAAWEQKWSSSDPDYNIKKDNVLERLEVLLVRARREGRMPQTAKEAVDLANKARKDVESELRQSKVRKPVSTVEGGGSNISQPDPKDTRDVIRRTLGN